MKTRQGEEVQEVVGKTGRSMQPPYRCALVHVLYLGGFGVNAAAPGG